MNTKMILIKMAPDEPETSNEDTSNDGSGPKGPKETENDAVASTTTK